MGADGSTIAEPSTRYSANKSGLVTNTWPELPRVELPKTSNLPRTPNVHPWEDRPRTASELEAFLLGTKVNGNAEAENGGRRKIEEGILKIGNRLDLPLGGSLGGNKAIKLSLEHKALAPRKGLQSPGHKRLVEDREV